jgi:hypothetical protein
MGSQQPPGYPPPAGQQPVYQQPAYQQPVAQQPGYQYPVQQPAYQQGAYQQAGYQYPAYPQNYYAPAPARPKSSATRGCLILGSVVLGIVLLGAVVLTVVAIALTTPVKPTCTVHCGPTTAQVEAGPNTYRNPNFKYEVDYPSTWKLASSDSSGATFETRLKGIFVVASEKAGRQETDLVQAMVDNLPSTYWQSIQPIGPIRGAHIGFQSGTGQYFSANFQPKGGQAVKVRIAVIASTKNGVSVAVMGIDPADTKNFPSGIPEGSTMDYILSQFRWPAK